MNISEPLKVGDNISLSCTATGVPLPLLQWYKDSIVITNESMISSSISTGETNIGGVTSTVSILHLSSLNEFDSGTYSCEATNFAGNATYEFEIQVTGGMTLYCDYFHPHCIVLFGCNQEYPVMMYICHKGLVCLPTYCSTPSQCIVTCTLSDVKCELHFAWCHYD